MADENLLAYSRSRSAGVFASGPLSQIAARQTVGLWLAMAVAITTVFAVFTSPLLPQANGERSPWFCRSTSLWRTPCLTPLTPLRKMNHERIHTPTHRRIAPGATLSPRPSRVRRGAEQASPRAAQQAPQRPARLSAPAECAGRSRASSSGAEGDPRRGPVQQPAHPRPRDGSDERRDGGAGGGMDYAWAGRRFPHRALRRQPRVWRAAPDAGEGWIARAER